MDAGNEDAVYKGTVKTFKANHFLVITPTDDLSEAGVKNNKVEASVSDVFTSESPVYLQKEQEVEFKLTKDEYGVYANFVSSPGGAAVVNTEVPEPKQEQLERTAINDGQAYNGTVKAFNWGAGFGFVVLAEDSGFELADDVDFPEKEKFLKSKKLWFHRTDITSTDAAVGVSQGAEVQFTIYTDSKGIGAREVAQRGGEAISGDRYNLRRKPKQKKSKKRTSTQAGFSMGNMQNMQIVMMNGVPYMMMPMQGGPQKKKQKKNKERKQKKREGDWIGPCGYHNFAHRTKCGGTCGKDKSEGTLCEVEEGVGPREEQPKREGDWIGPCGYHNFAHREKCNGCGSEKSEGKVITAEEADEPAATSKDGMEVEDEANTTAL